MLIVFRFLAGCFGSAPLTLGGGTIADLMPASKRAKAMSIWVMGPTIGPVVGPIAGAFISEFLGWRWNFWILVIATGAIALVALLVMKETYAPTLLKRKTERLRKETGNLELKSKLDSNLTAKDLFLLSIIRPTKLLLFSPIVFCLSLYVAIVYAYLYLFFTTISQVMVTQYGFRNDLSGLGFLGLGIGQFGGQFLYSWIAGRMYEKAKEKGEVKPENRLHLMIVGAVFIPIGLFWYGWGIQSGSHWINPIIATGVFAFGLLFIWVSSTIHCCLEHILTGIAPRKCVSN
jgi:MFS family permease